MILQGKGEQEGFPFVVFNIAQLLGILDDGDKAYFDNVQFEHLLSKFMRREKLD